jgi:hypothetical protein
MSSWLETLKQKTITKETIKLAEDFYTCPVSEQEYIPRADSGIVSSKKLTKLGYDFLSACEEKDLKQARLVYKKINKEGKIEGKRNIQRLRKIIKKKAELLEQYNAGIRIFGVSIDKEGDIVGVKEGSKFLMKVPDGIFSDDATS